MPFVLDASVAACWPLPDERHPAADAAYALIGQDWAMASSLWWYEIRNIFIINERRGRLDSGRTAQALRLLRDLPVTIDRDVDEGTLLRLARQRRLSIYDAAYLELARRENVSLATLDVALANAARAEHVQLIGDPSI
jgi:predicted nucleic acid-binding protein